MSPISLLSSLVNTFLILQGCVWERRPHTSSGTISASEHAYRIWATHIDQVGSTEGESWRWYQSIGGRYCRTQGRIERFTRNIGREEQDRWSSQENDTESVQGARSGFEGNCSLRTFYVVWIAFELFFSDNFMALLIFIEWWNWETCAWTICSI